MIDAITASGNLTAWGRYQRKGPEAPGDARTLLAETVEDILKEQED
ncbi:hypothetical protein J6524_18620 [Bradyrhizobium sp. WSM 1738]|nr:hypothetical protein [Bradyrhizobium hereditatis]MCA6116882.1 hypothetical protein [Bradyrhizobium hereditatis]